MPVRYILSPGDTFNVVDVHSQYIHVVIVVCRIVVNAGQATHGSGLVNFIVRHYEFTDEV